MLVSVGDGPGGVGVGIGGDTGAGVGVGSEGAAGQVQPATNVSNNIDRTRLIFML